MEFGGLYLLQMPIFSDERGLFVKLADKRLTEIRAYDQRQLNYVLNKKKFTCRGLHYQKNDYAESKIFRALTGSILVVAFNVQPQSSQFKKTFSKIIDRPELALWVPRGFATGYCTLEENTTVLYSSDNDYHPEAEAGIRWNDPSLRIRNLPHADLVISEKDTVWMDFNCTL
jgi:dTDP-4-dehydrorhamnose 3,5-epimerase